jgi:hypothetical protein
LIEALQRDEPVPTAAVSDASRPAGATTPTSAREDVLDELLLDQESTPSSPMPSTPVTPAPERPAGHDDAVIDDLLGGDDRSRGS